MSNYSIEEKDFSKAQYISANRDMMAKFSRPKAKEFPNAKYIWPMGYVRFHLYRLFTPKKKIKKAELAFLSDNIFDLWINGRQVAENTKHIPLTDVTEFIGSSENNLHIRGYQTDTDETFSSAMTGGIRLYYEDGETEEIVTDENFKQVSLIDFGVNEEPEGFETATEGKSNMSLTPNVMPQHPIALRRSFYFVKNFSVVKEIESAVLYASALGCYEPYMNGERIADNFFMPFCTNYRKEYQQFNIKPFIKSGDNTIGAILGNGSYNCVSWGSLSAKIPEFIAEIEIKYCDGTTEIIKTDSSWKCIPSPLIDNDIQFGERYDARLETENWCSDKVDKTLLLDVFYRENTENKTLIYQNYPPIKRMAEHKAKFVKFFEDGSPLYDGGICIAGRARVTFKNLPRGKKIRIRYCERLTDGGVPHNGAYTPVFYRKDAEAGGKTPDLVRNMDVYFAKGEETETYECRFSYTGLRFVWIEGLDSLEQLKEVVIFELYNDLETVGEIETSDQNIKRIFNATKRAWFNNISNGPTDCPSREKNYWNGDMQIFSHMACWLTDNSKFLSRWTDNGIKMHPGPYAWEDETYVLPYTLYKFYGDKEILKKRFPEMLSLIERRQEFEGMILPEKGISHQYNDWLSPERISPDTEFFGGCWYYHMLDTVSKIAEIIGEGDKSEELKKRAEASRIEFNKRHLNKEGNDYDAKNQCGIILPLAFGIAPKVNRQALADTLVKYIADNGYRVSTGFIGTRYMFDVLSSYGYSDVAYKVFTNPAAPSWLDMLNTGATAITEDWSGQRSDGSMSHFSLGAVCEWLFEYLGGIRINESEAGLKKIVLKPVMLKEIGDFSVKYKSEFGTISTQWHFEEGKPVFNYSVPEGIDVEVIL